MLREAAQHLRGRNFARKPFIFVLFDESGARNF